MTDQLRTLVLVLELVLVLVLVSREFSPSHKRNKKIARKIGSFLGAEANKSKDEDDSLISDLGSKLSKVEEKDEFQFVFPASPQLLKEGLCRSERRPLFRRVAREKAQPVMRMMSGILFSFPADLAAANIENRTRPRPWLLRNYLGPRLQGSRSFACNLEITKKRPRFILGAE